MVSNCGAFKSFVGDVCTPSFPKFRLNRVANGAEARKCTSLKFESSYKDFLAGLLGPMYVFLLQNFLQVYNKSFTVV